MNSNPCKPTEHLKAWSLGQLPDDESEQLSQHIANCPVCEETLAGLDDTADSFVQSVRQAGDETQGTSDPSAVLNAAIAQVTNPYDNESEDSASGVLEQIRDYELLEPLGYGGMGTVYRARHQSLDRIVAVKLLPGRRLRAPQAVERFRREMKAIGRLNHPSIVRATDAGEVDGTHYLAMDYIRGIDLSRLVKLTGPLPAADACEVIRQAAVALQYAHDQGLIHRDVKPGNLMLELTASAHDEPTSVTVKVMDLGLALFGAASEMIDELTTVGQLMGTLDYMAPEQADSSHTVDVTADVYSLGATLYKLLSGHAPYETNEYRTPLKKMKALSLIDAPEIADRCAGLPDRLAALINRMLSRDPKKRPQSAQEVANLLQPFCSGHHLQKVLQRGLTQLERQRAASEPDRTPSQVGAASPVAKPAVPPRDLAPEAPRPVAAQSGSRRGRRVLTICAALAGIFGLASVIWLQTDKGMLRIESAVGDVPIEIRRGDEAVDSLTLTTGSNEVRLKSGQYTVLLPVEYDELRVINGQVTIERGGNWVARVTEMEQTHSEDVPAREERPEKQLTYEGKTFSEWKRMVLTERSPKSLKQAIHALCDLGRKNRDAEAAAAVLDVVSTFDTRMHLKPALYSWVSRGWGLGLGGGESGISETGLLLTALDQLRNLEVNAVVKTVCGQIAQQDADVQYFIATVLAPQGTWAPLTTSQSAGPGGTPVRDGTRLAKAFNESDEYLNVLETHFDTLTEELRFNYLGHLIDRELTSSATHTPLTERQQSIIGTALDGTYGRRCQDTACAMAVLLNPGSKIVQVLLDLIESGQPDEAKHGDSLGEWASTDWSSIPLVRWVILKRIAVHIRNMDTFISYLTTKEIAALVRGRWDDNRRSTVLGPDKDYFMNPVEPSISISKATLAAEILASKGPGAQQAVPALVDRIEAICGIRPNKDGKWGYVSRRESSVIPSLESVFKQNSDEAGFSSVDQALNELDALIYAMHQITGEPVRFETVPDLVKQNAYDLGDESTTGKQVFQLAQINGYTLNSLKSQVDQGQPKTLRQVEASVGGLFEYYQLTGQDEESAQELLVSLHDLMRHAVTLPPDDDATIIVDLLESLAERGRQKTHTVLDELVRQSFHGMLTDLLQNATHPNWQQLLIDRFLVTMRSVTKDGAYRDYFPYGPKTAELHGYVKAAHFPGDPDELTNVLDELCSQVHVLPDGLRSSLLNCVDVLPDLEQSAPMLVMLLNEGTAYQQMRAASSILRKNHPDETIRRQATQHLISMVLKSDSLVDATNAMKAILQAGDNTVWRNTDVSAIRDYLDACDLAAEPTATLSVPIMPIKKVEGTWFQMKHRLQPVHIHRPALLLQTVKAAPPELAHPLLPAWKTLQRQYAAMVEGEPSPAPAKTQSAWFQLMSLQSLEVNKVTDGPRGVKADDVQAWLHEIVARLE